METRNLALPAKDVGISKTGGSALGKTQEADPWLTYACAHAPALAQSYHVRGQNVA